MNAEARVNDERQGRQIMREVCRALRDHEGIDLGDGSWIHLALKAPEELRRQSGTAYCRSPRGLASYRRRSNGSRSVTADYRITICLGLSPADFAACCAHELGHIYQYRENFPELPIVVSEGLCELFKFAWLKAQGRTVAERELRRMLRNPDPVYGEGFRLACQSLIDRTLAEVLAHVRCNGHLPPHAAAYA